MRIGSSRLSSTHLPGRGSGTSDGGIASQFDVESFWPLKFPVVEKDVNFHLKFEILHKNQLNRHIPSKVSIISSILNAHTAEPGMAFCGVVKTA